MTEDVRPPGRARILACPECRGAAGRSCRECRGAGVLLQRACPRCGDIAWDYINGLNDRGGMACRISCGYTWQADHPAWQAQTLPAT